MSGSIQIRQQNIQNLSTRTAIPVLQNDSLGMTLPWPRINPSVRHSTALRMSSSRTMQILKNRQSINNFHSILWVKIRLLIKDCDPTQKVKTNLSRKTNPPFVKRKENLLQRSLYFMTKDLKKCMSQIWTQA